MKSLIKEKTKDKIFYWCMLAIPLLQFAIFYVYVNINSVILSFQTYDGLTTNTFSPAGFSNFLQIFKDIGSEYTTFGSYRFSYGVAIRNSVLVYLFTLLLSPLSMMYAYYIYKKRFASSFIKIVLFAPSIVSGLAIVTVYTNMMDVFIPNVLNNIFGTNIKALLKSDGTMLISLWLFIIIYFNGSSIMYYFGAMNNVSDSTIEAGYLDGCVGIKEFIHIVFPQIYGTFSVFFITGISALFINQFNLFTFYAYMAPERYATVGYVLYLKLARSSGMNDYPYIAALGLLITLVTSVLVITIRKVIYKLDPMK